VEITAGCIDGEMGICSDYLVTFNNFVRDESGKYMSLMMGG
jgi:hypothetical protein